MKKYILLFVVISYHVAFAQSEKPLRVVPEPVSVAYGTGIFYLSKETALKPHDASAQKSAELFNYYLQKLYGFTLKINSGAISNFIDLSVISQLPKDAYRATVSSKSVEITGDQGGLLYGGQTILQAITNINGKLAIPTVTVNDQPAFAYRGIMLDVCRHFFSVEEIKKILDAMAFLKLNRFYWHLSDDQGWRLEIKKYPRLTEVGAWRDSTIIGGQGENKPFIYDGIKTGGYYTQAEARAIVAYAARRNIEVVPEIEMPGHSTAALAAYPELGNGAASYQVPGYFGVHRTIYSPSDRTFQFIEDVLTEVMAIFPSKYIHIGGDEVPKDEWKASSLAQKLIAENHLKDENELQSWFIQKIEKFLNARGRNLIGWDEILEGGLAPNATVMSWRGEEGGIQAAKQKHYVVMSPGPFVYLDHYQSKDIKNEPLAIGGFLPLDKTYNYYPVPPSLTPDELKYILGVQGNMWTEYVPSNEKLEYMIFPRALAVAEVGWSRLDRKNYDDFAKNRLPKVLTDMDKFGVNYRIPEAMVSQTKDIHSGRRQVSLTQLVANGQLYYTLDGHKADNTATLYNGPVTLPYADGRPITLKYVIITAKGRSSTEFTLNL